MDKTSNISNATFHHLGMAIYENVSYIKKPRWERISGIMHYTFNWLPKIRNTQLRWKDKFQSPRCEMVPIFEISWLWFNLTWCQGNDEYWERYLWIHNYNDGDEYKAIRNWGWQDMDGNSSWFNVR